MMHMYIYIYSAQVLRDAQGKYAQASGDLYVFVCVCVCVCVCVLYTYTNIYCLFQEHVEPVSSKSGRLTATLLHNYYITSLLQPTDSCSRRGLRLNRAYSLLPSCFTTAALLTSY